MFVQRNVNILQLITIFRNALFIIPVIVLYYRDEIGLSFQDFLIAEACFAATIFFLEVPSGWLSDIWKRKYVLILSQFTWVLGSVILLLADNLYWAIASQIIHGISYTLFSGTDSSLLYDTLLAGKKQTEFSKIEGRRKGYGFYFLAFCSVLGAYLYSLNHDYPILLTVIIQTIGLIVGFWIIEPKRHKSASVGNPFTDMVKTMHYALRGHAEIGLIIIFSAAFFATTKQIMWIQQPYYIAMNIPETWYGVLIAVGFLTGGLGSHVNHVLAKYFSNATALIIVWLFTVFICFLSAIGLGWHGVILLMFGGTFIYGLANPRVLDAIHQRVGSDRRATIVSTGSFLRELIAIPLSIFIGYIVSTYSVGTGLYAISFWLVLSGFALVFWNFIKKNTK